MLINTYINILCFKNEDIKRITHTYTYIFFLFSVFKPVTFNTTRPQSYKTTYIEKRIKG